MDTIRVDKLKRDPSKIRSYFKRIKTTTVTSQPIQIVFPARYLELKLARIDSLVDLLNMYVIIDSKDNYAVTIAPIIGKYIPESVNYIMINSEKYVALSFKAGETVIANNNMLADDSIIYTLFQEFFLKGNIPWYYNYEDVSNIFLETSKYADSGVGNNPVTIEILTSVLARVANNRKLYFKDSITSRNDIFRRPPGYVGISDIRYNFDSTSSKLIGGYFKEGVINAIVDPETKTTKLADNLRY